MATIHPVRYGIHITPDLDRFSFQGQVTIDFQAETPTPSIILNALELTIERCRLREREQWRTIDFSVDAAKETLTLKLPEPQSGRIVVRIDYQGSINDKMSGFYRSQATHGEKTYHLAVTQFQESSARQAFPCMDHPLHKAVFELTLTAPNKLTVLGNTLPLREEAVNETHKRVVFQETPQMSTYLLFFGLGEFELARDAEDQRVRLAHLPGLGHTTALGLTFGRQALQYCESYYDIEYPLPKMDLIAVPDFAFGAMENWGAITFRENLLLHFPDLTSKSGVQRICEVIAHEIAHQWFGNLVTPADWKYLWLNESFATYFGYGVVAHYQPQWGIWDQFLLTETASAMARDGLRETFAIEIPGGEHVVINSSTAPIIYNKGASILRMIEGYIGREAYQQGVRAYLRQHQYACAESQDLWRAFEGASAEPISAMMQSWIGQPGHPRLAVSRQDDTLTLRQERFTYLDKPSDQLWNIPVTLNVWTADGAQHERAFSMQDKTATVKLPADSLAYKFNTNQTGFYRVAYEDPANETALGRLIAEQRLSAEDRWGIQNDLYAMVRGGRRSMNDYLAYLAHYRQESAFLPLASITGHLFQAFLVAPEDRREPIIAQGRDLAGRALERIGYSPVEGELHTTAILRDQLLWQGAVWGFEPAARFAAEQFARMTAGHPVHPDISRAVMQLGAWQGDAAALSFLCSRFAQSPSEHERMNILAALGTFQKWDLCEEALNFSLQNVPPRNRFIPIVALAANAAARPHLWPWYQSQVQTLEKFHPLLYERVITAIIPYGGLDREAEVRGFAKDYMQTHEALGDAIRLALENLEINSGMRTALK